MTKEEIREELLVSVNAYKNGARDRAYVQRQIDYYRTTYDYWDSKEILDMLEEIDQEKGRAADMNDFRIQNGILTAYSGKEAKVYIPNNVNEIADYAFSTNTSIKKVIFRDKSLRKIGIGAFSSCSNLESIELPEGTYLIADDAFRGCTKMQYAIIPPSVKYISADVFDGDSRTIIVSEPGSEAESYANRNSISFKTIGEFRALQSEASNKEKNKKKDSGKDKSLKTIGKTVATSKEAKETLYYILLTATILLTVLTAYFWIKTGTFNDAPYATGPYGSNVVHPVNPYRKYVFICGPLACLACCLMTNAKD